MKTNGDSNLLWVVNLYVNNCQLNFLFIESRVRDRDLLEGLASDVSRQVPATRRLPR